MVGFWSTRAKISAAATIAFPKSGAADIASPNAFELHMIQPNTLKYYTIRILLEYTKLLLRRAVQIRGSVIKGWLGNKWVHLDKITKYGSVRKI